ncbi:hypothetical protein [Ancylomarina longa]|uniref:Uncharacterized protein n=1 Tax=Ancylomarina longa TaxID=2487017 RepID=A0A434ATK8_9BACT|nr:hypothetical protein [Ancylomarina longa]RUT77772.1 hypothetical protein DLK05_11240 [Ancylomarina longa]
MLDTVIKIGKLYREALNAHKYHEQINHAWKDVEALRKKKDKDGNVIDTVFYELPVIDKGNTFEFNFENLKEIEDEDKQKQIYYLNFKTSKKDAEKRYLFGDIVYSHFIDNKNKLNEFGNYRLFGKWENKSSFEGAEPLNAFIKSDNIKKFRYAYRNKKEQFEMLIKSKQSIVLHFTFNTHPWYKLPNIVEDVDSIILFYKPKGKNESLVGYLEDKLDKDFIDNNNLSAKLTLNKYLYKTLGGVTPGFSEVYSYKNKVFTIDNVISLMYATQVYQDPIIRINQIGIIALPHSDKITSEEIVSFFNREQKSISTQARKEETIVLESDDIFAPLTENLFADTVKFDIIFSSIPKSPSGVFSDLIEISNIEKSLLKQVHEHILSQKAKILNRTNKAFPNTKKPFAFSVRYSFLKILGDVTKDKKKYQSHLLKVLPQLYSNTYYQDPILLPAFIEKVEYNIREGGQLFNILKYDFYFLMNIQKNNNLMKITETKSYDLGKNLGIMANRFAAWRDDCPIKSFEKSYVGNLSRRITSIEELVKFSGFLNEKLTIHGFMSKSKYIYIKDAYSSLVETINNFEGEKYNRHNCALGFFESYYGKRVSNTEQQIN